MDLKQRVLYISYDGMTDPLGQSQVLSYLRQLNDLGFGFDVVSFDKFQAFGAHAGTVRASIAQNDIVWHPLPYTKWPPVLSTFGDLCVGLAKSQQVLKTNQFGLVHARGYISAILANELSRRTGIPWIFDMRGWWADEKRESGTWNSPAYWPVYHLFKKLEKRFFRKCSHIISLTQVGKTEIERLVPGAHNKISVIPTCVDFDKFRAFSPDARQELREQIGIPRDSVVLVYSGSLGGNYSVDLLFDIYRALLRGSPDAHLLVLSKSDPMLVQSEFQGSARVHFYNLEYAQVGNFLMAGDIGAINYAKSYSLVGRSPTKLGEYWACGLPVIAPHGIGDVDILLSRYPGGGLFDPQDPNTIEQAFIACLALLPLRAKLRSFASAYYDLETGARQYADIYNKLTFDRG